MPDTTAAASAAITKAIEEAKRAYQFGASSYSYSALSACLAAERALTAPDWVGEVLAYAEAA